MTKSGFCRIYSHVELASIISTFASMKGIYKEQRKGMERKCVHVFVCDKRNEKKSHCAKLHIQVDCWQFYRFFLANLMKAQFKPWEHVYFAIMIFLAFQ